VNLLARQLVAAVTKSSDRALLLGVTFEPARGSYAGLSVESVRTIVDTLTRTKYW
jgi:hypothetical protein